MSLEAMIDGLLAWAHESLGGRKNFSIQGWPLYKGLQLEKYMYSEYFFMIGAILKATNSSFQEGIAFCRSIYVKKVMKVLAFIFEQPS